MPKVVVRKGYRCKPGKRREVLAALQRVDEAGAAAGWPRGRYLFVETRAPGEPDLEVEFTFESYAELERLERRLREHLARAARDVAGAGQDLLLEPSATRYLVLLDEAGARSAAPAVTTTAAPPPAPPPPPAAEGRVPPPIPEPEERAPAPPPEPALTVAQQRARQLAAARAAMESAEQTAGMPAERRASGRTALPPRRAPSPPIGGEGEEEEDEALDASA